MQVVQENAELAGSVADLNAQLAAERERCDCLEVCLWLCSVPVRRNNVLLCELACLLRRCLTDRTKARAR